MRSLSRILLICMFLAIILTLFCTAPSDEKKTAFENNLIELTFSQQGVSQTANTHSLFDRMSAYGTPGACVTLVENKRIQWTGGYGVRASNTADSVTGRTIFQAGSVSKFVTGVLTMHLIESGILELDTDINHYLSSWKMPENEYGKSITLRQLLSHQSGLPGTNFDSDPEADLPALPQILNGEAPARNKPAFPTFEPGSMWSYSNIGYVVIQLILEDVTGKTLDALAADIIFKPLNMRSTTFNYPLAEAQQKFEALPHAEGEVKPVAQDTRARAQGGLLTTTEDMALLVIEIMKAYSGESDRILSKAAARQMIHEEIAIPIQAFGLPFGMGLGVLIDNTGSSVSFLHPGQSYPGSAFLFVAFPETGQAVVMGLNAARGEQLQLEFLATLARIYQFPSGEYFK